jgi:hypothetical protein
MKMGKHSWLMMAGCGVMLVGVFLLPLLGVRLGGVLPFLLALACPLSMVLMMGSMGRGHDHSGRAAPERVDVHQNQCHGDTASRTLPAPTDKGWRDT